MKKEQHELIEAILQLPLKSRYDFNRIYFLLNENVEYYISDRPFVVERLRISDYFLQDIQLGVNSLENFIKENDIKTFYELMNKKPIYSFRCKNSENYEKSLTNKFIPIYCRMMFNEIPGKEATFGDTQKFTQNGQDAIIVTIYENNFIKLMMPSYIGLSAKDIPHKNLKSYPIELYLDVLKQQLQPSHIYRSNYVHEFQHVMQIVHNIYQDDKYDLDGDLDKIEKLAPNNFNDYYSIISEKEAFFIQILNLLDENGILVKCKSSQELKSEFIKTMKEIGILDTENLFYVFEKPLKAYCENFILTESLSDKKVKDILSAIGSSNPKETLKIFDKLKTMNRDELSAEFRRFVRNGVK